MHTTQNSETFTMIGEGAEVLGLSWGVVEMMCYVRPARGNWLIPGEEIVGAGETPIHVVIVKDEGAAS